MGYNLDDLPSGYREQAARKYREQGGDPGTVTQTPLAGTGGRSRTVRPAATGKKAAAAQADALTVGRSTLPLQFVVRIPPDRVFLSIKIRMEPQPKERHRRNRSRLAGTGYVEGGVSVSGNVYVVEGHEFTPTATRQATEVLAVLFRRHADRRFEYPIVEPVGMNYQVRTAYGRTGDWDNLGKILSDAGNPGTDGTAGADLWVDDKLVRRGFFDIVYRSPSPGIDLVAWIL